VYAKMQAQAMLHAMMGGRATEEGDAPGKILARLQPDGRPLLGAAHPSLSNLVAGARYFDWKKIGSRSSCVDDGRAHKQTPRRGAGVKKGHRCKT